MQDQDAILDVFNFSIDDIEAAVSSGPSQFFTPNPKKGVAGVYNATIRFIPWHLNVKDSIIKKAFFYLENPVTKENFSVDCPSNLNQDSILQKLFWKFWGSDSAVEKEKSKYFKRKDNYYSIVQIVEDKNKPDTVGKLMIYKYPFKVYEKIEAQKKPKFGQPNNPFDLFTGKLFGLSVKLVSGWNNYDDCTFIDGSSGPIYVGGKPMDSKVPADREAIKEYLKTSPNLDDQKGKPWTREEEAKVMDVIRYYTGATHVQPQQSAQPQAAPVYQQQPVYQQPVQEQYAQPQYQQPVYQQQQPVTQQPTQGYQAPMSQPVQSETYVPQPNNPDLGEGSPLDDLYADL